MVHRRRWEELRASEGRVEEAIDQLIPVHIRAGGFPTATHIECMMGDPTEWGRFDLALTEIHDADGLLAHAAHREDRSTSHGQAFDLLAAAMQLELNLLWRVKSLGLGQQQDDPYWGPVVLLLGASPGAQDRFSVLLPEAGDELPADLPPPPSSLPTHSESVDLEGRLRDGLRDLDDVVARVVRDLRRGIEHQMRELGPDGLATVEVVAELLEWPPPSISVSTAYDEDGTELELDWEADDVEGLLDYFRLTEAIGRVVFDVRREGWPRRSEGGWLSDSVPGVGRIRLTTVAAPRMDASPRCRSGYVATEATQHKRPTVVREALRIAYLLTEVMVADGRGIELPAEAAARERGDFWVVTAANPFGSRLPDDENLRRHERLVARLADEGVEWLPARGCAANGSWSEQSVAVFGIGPRRARSLGRQVQQNAVFEITEHELAVNGCFGSWRRARPHGSSWQPDSYTELPLAAVAKEALGVDFDTPFWRFRQPGWRVDGDTSLPCDECGRPLVLASALLCSKAREWYEARAILCRSCLTAKLPSHLSEELREAVYLWADWRLVEDDAAKQEHNGERRCYVVALQDPMGATLRPDVEWVYVGETGNDVEVRFLEHLLGTHASSVVKRYGTHLREDLMVDLPVHGSAEESRAFEAYLAARLRLEGYGVKGGH